MPTLERKLTPELQKTLDQVRNTQRVVPPLARSGQLQSFPARTFETHGHNVLVVVPTANVTKAQEIGQKFQDLVPASDLYMVGMNPHSNVGEQPYNEAGLVGAFNRLNNGFNMLDTSDYRNQMKEWKIGTVIGMSIENFIQVEFDGEKITSAVDYGAIVVHNATTGKTNFAISEGVPMDPAYVEIARSFGFEDAEKKHGKVTAGEVFAAHVRGVDPADWQGVVTGVPRYATLRKAMDAMKIPIDI